MITPERAKEIQQWILSTSWLKPQNGPTDEEDREVRAFWDTLDGGTSYYDAVARMARGDHLIEEEFSDYSFRSSFKE